MESDEKPAGKHIVSHRKEKERFLDFLRAAPSNEFGLGFLKRVATLRTGSATHAATGFLRAPAFARTVDWRAVRGRCVGWARHPTNAALLVWLAFVAGGVAFVFLLMTGALNAAVPDAWRRRRWAEVANQVLNALFTVMCVYQHPRLCHHLFLLLRWRAADAADLRAVYCKNASGGGGGLPRERLHVALVVALLHATCVAQYAYCALFWFFRSGARPDWAVNLCMALGLGAPAAAALYMVHGPLGRRTIAGDGDQEAAAPRCGSSSSRTRRAREWAGGVLDLGDDPAAAALSLTCTFCVFGWNAERLGLGNMYVHAFTFALLCAAPVLVFAVAALNVRDATLGFLVGTAGALLSVLGLLYGGYWRARMRARLGLPAHRAVCGGSDYATWLLCAPCALAQEVRTANLYDVDVEGGGLYLTDDSEETPAMAPLQREGCVAPMMADEVDAPPVPVVIERR